MVLTRSLATINNVQEDKPQPTTLEKQVQVLTAAVECLTRQTRSWKSSYIGRQVIMLQKTWKIPVLSGRPRRTERK